MRFFWLISLLFASAAMAQHPAAVREDILIADFEGDDYGAWKTTGTAFGSRPARGTLPGQMYVEGYLGKGLVNSFLGGDEAVGTLTSPPIKIERKHINFLIGGGGWKNETCIQLKIGGKIVRTATGPNTESGGSERLDWSSWDVSEFLGQEAVIEIVDSRKGGWGHINVDQITQSDVAKAVGPGGLSFPAEKRYLRLPVKRGAPLNRLKVYADRTLIIDCDIQLSDDPSAQPYLVDLTNLAKPNATLELQIARVASDSPLIGPPEGDSWKWLTDDAEEGLADVERPRFHFTARRGWLNDPNGLVYHDGKYHLYFQFNPYGAEWGNMHWGHAVSTDLLNWTELPIAIKPPRHGDWAFSGSAIVDVENRSGFGTKEKPALVAAWTSTGRGECIAYSHDGGLTFKEYEGNPVVKHQGRDPRLLWHEPTNQFVMAVYDESEGKQWIAFYISPDLKKWTFTSKIEGYYECPELFSLKAGGEGPEKWILYAADGEYVIGEFNGREFKPETKKQRLWYGNFYASQTISNEPKGRRIQIGWARGIDPKSEVFNQQMNVPVELSLQKSDKSYRLHAWPVAEINQNGGEPTRLAPTLLKQGETRLGACPDIADVSLEFARIDGDLDIEIAGNRIRILADEGAIDCAGVKAPQVLKGLPLRLRILLDRHSIELFVNGGETAICAPTRRPADGEKASSGELQVASKAECQLEGGYVREVLAKSATK